MTEIPARSGDQEQGLGRDEVQILDPEPALLIQNNFSRCAISFHYVLLNELGSGPETAGNPFSSFERDLLAHSFRDSSLIYSDVLLSHGFPMTVTFPSWLSIALREQRKSCGLANQRRQSNFSVLSQGQPSQAQSTRV
jgi:hypothetical protein